MEVTRRAAVLGGTAAAAAAFASEGLAAPFAWQARHGMTSGQYQQAFDNLVSQGYRLAHVDGYAVAGQPLFAAIWNKVAGPPWQARHDMDAARYQMTFDQMSAQGYRLVKVSGYDGGNGALYAALWVQRPGPDWRARHGMSSAEYQQTFDNLTGQGYRLAWVNGYGVAGVPYFAAIFERSPGPAYLARHGMTSDQYQAAFDSAVAQGYRLRHVDGYTAGGGVPNFAAIWDRIGGGPWQARHNLTSAQYQARFDTFTQQGYRLADVSGYDADGQAMYAALWTQP